MYTVHTVTHGYLAQSAFTLCISCKYAHCVYILEGSPMASEQQHEKKKKKKRKTAQHKHTRGIYTKYVYCLKLNSFAIRLLSFINPRGALRQRKKKRKHNESSKNNLFCLFIVFSPFFFFSFIYSKHFFSLSLSLHLSRTCVYLFNIQLYDSNEM